MNITDQFRVAVPVDEAWLVLLDVERIAPCLPGAQLQEIDGDEYRGIVKVKVGPISAQYKGTARVIEADEGARRIVLQGDGRDTRGQGNASATITVTMVADGDGTTIGIDTELNVTGKVAQFGRGVMADVSAKLLRQFAANLESDVLARGGMVGERVAPEPSAAAGGAANCVRRIEGPEVEPIDLLDAAGGAMARRVLPAIAVVVVVAVLIGWLVTG